ncbi:GAF domain-containing sensor histidine kinase [Magnetospirillum sp. UT-4]|uniref:GAF domain-containing sensor histidine kinase n=1 Tax=Magnetospirillum sp. UT-4 TaxID=2681467 RepID=UPI001572F157|nr:GAF domain-containing sensor histidine kinase [Magnetospirillum sp. UT-4]
MLVPIPADDENRLAALRRYAILDTPPEAVFDGIVALLRDLLDTPIVTVSLVDRERQWFKARLGTETTETPRSIAFCAHAIMGEEVMEIEDAAADPRFACSPLVVDGPRVRYYVGAPLLTPDGYALGTLCAYDLKPRRLSEAQRRHLVLLAATVMNELELRRTAHELAAALAEAERVNVLRSQLLAAVSHDLRSPLHAVLGYSELLLQPAGDADQRRQWAEAIDAVGRQMLWQVDDLLDMAAVEAGHFSVELGPVPLAASVEAASRLVVQRVEQAGITFETRLAEGLAPVLADGRRLTQVLANLLDNAVKFTPAGGRVTVSASRDGAVVVVEVADTGIGIAPADLPRVLEPYGQARPGVAQRGTGLGLPLAKAMTEAQGGTFSIVSTPGEGTRVRLALPTDSQSVLAPL